MASKGSQTDSRTRKPQTHRSTQHVFNPRSRVCGVSLLAHDQGTMCILLTVSDAERARPRKMVTGRTARFDRFPLFSASLECKQKVTLGQWPKTAEIDQASEGQRVRTTSFYIFYTSTRPPQHSRTVSLQMKSGREGAVNREANLPAYSSPPPKAALCFNSASGGRGRNPAGPPSTRPRGRRSRSRDGG